MQLIDSIPGRWTFIIKENYENDTNLIIHDHHLIKGSRVITLDKLTLTKMYSILISKVKNKPFSDIYFETRMTLTLTGQESIYYHALLRTIPIFSIQNLEQCFIS